MHFLMLIPLLAVKGGHYFQVHFTNMRVYSPIMEVDKGHDQITGFQPISVHKGTKTGDRSVICVLRLPDKHQTVQPRRKVVGELKALELSNMEFLLGPPPILDD